MKTISIVIPTRNRPDFLKRCLDALHEQLPQLYMSNIIVVDDGSEIELSEKNRIICTILNATFLTHNTSLGPAAARNTGIFNSTCDWIAFLDDDVVINQGWFDNLNRAINNCPETCIGIEGSVQASGKGIWDTEVQNTIGGAYLSCNMIYQRLTLLEEHGFDTNFKGPFCEDHELAARMLQRGSILFCQEMSVTHLPRSVNIFKYVLTAPSRIKLLLESEYHFFTSHPDRYHLFRNHVTFTGTAISIALKNVVNELHRRSISQFIQHPGQTMVIITTALIEQLFALCWIILFLLKPHPVVNHFAQSIDPTATSRLWCHSVFNQQLFYLRRPIFNLILFKLFHIPVYNAKKTQKQLSSLSSSGPCDLFIRVDDIFIHNRDIVEHFAHIMKKESIPILACITGEDITNEDNWPIIKMLRENGAFIGIHGFCHSGTFGPFSSELLQLDYRTFSEKLSPVTKKLASLNQSHTILVPPFNAINKKQIVEWSKECKVICGGPETARFTDRMYGPLALTGGGWYFPSIYPFYSCAADMLTSNIPDLLTTLKGPICLTTHFTQESIDNFNSFMYLFQRVRSFTRSWDDTKHW